MILILYLAVYIMAQSDCDPKYTNLYPKQQQIANIDISEFISGFNCALINPPNGINLLQSGQILFSEAIQEDIEQVLFASILDTIQESSFYMEQIASLVQINKTSYQVLVVQKYYNQSQVSQLYSSFDSDYQCLSIAQMNMDFMIINCLSNQLVTIYQGDVQISTLPNITLNNYPSQIQISRNYNQLFVIFPLNLNESYVFQINISSTNIVDYTMISQTAYTAILYNMQVSQQYQFILTSQELISAQINIGQLSSINLTDCYNFNIHQVYLYGKNTPIKIMILCQNQIKVYQFNVNYFTFNENIPQPFNLKTKDRQNHIPLQFNRDYLILQYQMNYIIYEILQNQINLNSIIDQSVFILINPFSPTYYILSTTDVQMLSLQKPLLVINQLEQQLSNITLEISLNISLNISCSISLNIIPSANNNVIYQKNNTKLLPSKTTQSLPVIAEMSEYFIGSNISLSTVNNQSMINSYILDFYLINQTNSNSEYNSIMDSEVIFIQNQIYQQSNYLVYVQYANFTFINYDCAISESSYDYQGVFLTCSYNVQELITFNEQVQQVTHLSYLEYICVGFSTNILCFFIYDLIVNITYTVENPVIYMQTIAPLLFVMQKDIINVFDIYSASNLTIYNITNITPTQIIADIDVYGPLLFVNNQTQLLIYFCSPSQAQLINQIEISILDPIIIFSQQYLYISNSTVKIIYYIYNMFTISQIGSEIGTYAGQYYFNSNLKYYVLFSPDNILQIFQNSGQNNQLLKTIQLNSSIDQVTLTYYEKFIVINFLQNQQVITYLIDQYLTLILIPEILNNQYFIVNYSINASNIFSSSIIDSQIYVLNSGVFIFDNQQNASELLMSSDNQTFLLDPTFIKGQITNYQLNCFEYENCNVIQQYQLIGQNYNNCQSGGVVAIAQIKNRNLIALSYISSQIYLLNPLLQECQLFVDLPPGLSCQQIFDFSNLGILASFCQDYNTDLYVYMIVFYDSQYAQYNISQTLLTNMMAVDQFNAMFFYENNANTIELYQITVTEPVFELLITAQSQIVSYTVGGITQNDNNYMILMYITEEQDLSLNVFSAVSSNNYYNYSLLNTTSISISNLLEKYLVDANNVQNIQIVQIIMNNQYILSMQTILTTKYSYSYSININILIGSPDQITTQLNCLIPPYGNWKKLNQIQGNNQTLVLTYMNDTQVLTSLYDLNQCQNQSTLNFSVGIQQQFMRDTKSLPTLIYQMYPGANLFQSTCLTLIDYWDLFYYNLSKDIQINIQLSNNINSNQSVYLIASNYFMQYNATLDLIQNSQAITPIMAWWVWLLISLAIVVFVGVTVFLIIRKKRQNKEESFMEMK